MGLPDEPRCCFSSFLQCHQIKECIICFRVVIDIIIFQQPATPTPHQVLDCPWMPHTSHRQLGARCANTSNSPELHPPIAVAPSGKRLTAADVSTRCAHLRSLVYLSGHTACLQTTIPNDFMLWGATKYIDGARFWVYHLALPSKVACPRPWFTRI